MPEVDELKSGRFRVRWRDAAGNRVNPPGLSFPTRSAARTYGLDREAEVRRGEHRDPKAGRMLVSAWIDLWWDSRVGEDRTLAEERTTIDRYILTPLGKGKALGDYPLEAVDEMVVQGWVKRLEQAGLGAATVLRHYRVLTAILRPAVRARRIPADPFGDIKLPTVPPASDFYWERDEIAAVRAEFTDTQDLALFELLIGSGVRWGEAAGLHLPRWQPLRKRLVVLNVLVERRGFRLKEYPKGKHRRELVVAPRLVEAMATHLAATAPIDCGLDHGKGKHCPGLVFHAGGRPLSRHTWPRGPFATALAAAKVERVNAAGRTEKIAVRRGTVHDLRHTYASWRVIDGVPIRIVQELLGHASIRTTERYSHLAPSTLDDPRIMASLQDLEQPVVTPIGRVGDTEA